MKEVWKDVIGYEDYYQISNHGNVFSKRLNSTMSPETAFSGHKRVLLHKNGTRIHKLVHRLVAFHFIPENRNENNQIVNHLDLDPSNNHYSNLEWTTVRGNAIHARDNGRLIPPTGEKNGQAVLTEDIVIEIIEMWNKRCSQTKIANRFGVSRSAICHITQGKRWKHLQHLNQRGTKYKINTLKEIK